MSGSATDSEKPSDASHRWRRARAMASTKVGDGLSYKRPCAGSWGAVSATRGRPGWSRRRVPVGRACHGRWRDRHWRCVSTPRWVRTSWKVTSSCQRSTNHSRIWVGSAAGSVQSRGLSGEGALGVSDQHPANEDGGLAGAVPDRRLGSEFHGAGDASYQATSALAQVTSVCSRRTFSGGRRGPFNGGRPFWPG